MQRGERDLAGADEVQVVLGQVVDLLLGVGQEAGAVEGVLAHEHGRDHRLEAVAAQLLQRPADQRELEEDELGAQVGEARARQARRALHVDPLAGQLQVVARRRVHARLADLAHDGVLVGRARVGQVGQRAQRAAAARPRRGPGRLPAPWPAGPPRASRRSPRRRPRRPCGPARSRRWPRSGARAAPRARAGSRAGARRARARGRARRLRPGARAPPARAPGRGGSA